MYTHFTSQQLLPLYFSGFFLLSAVVCFFFSKKAIALTLLFIGTLKLGYFMANLDPYLNLWDEQYHALVAKNMLENPFKPTLYNRPLLDYNYQNWTYNHIWLHKQPLFLWQMALSMKTFGVSVISARIPSIVMHAFSALMIYKIGKITLNERIGFIAALFFAVSFYFIELISGKLPTEHNDTAFLFYIIASFWAWFEYSHTQKKYWLILIGLFSGCAILVKWLVGLLIYSAWALSLGVENRKNWIKLKTYFPLLNSLIVTTIVALPWQIYTFFAFPTEARHEFQRNSAHFFEVVENHSGDNWYHLNAISKLYGYGVLVPYLILLGLIVYLYQLKNNSYRMVVISSIFIVYLFFTLAQTKLTSFTMIVCPFIFLGLATIIDLLFNYLTRYIKLGLIVKISSVLILITISFMLLNLQQIELNHTLKDPSQNSNREVRLKEIEQFKQLDDYLKCENYVVFNLKSSEQCHISFMYLYDYVAYDYLPNSIEIEHLKSLNYKIAVVEGIDIPNYIYESEGVEVFVLD
jgi:4-amino-4-deoxy-L-arabinose transferase-like glycosyltransferase